VLMEAKDAELPAVLHQVIAAGPTRGPLRAKRFGRWRLSPTPRPRHDSGSVPGARSRGETRCSQHDSPPVPRRRGRSSRK
jgi:hypothetical protein